VRPLPPPLGDEDLVAGIPSPGSAEPLNAYSAEFAQVLLGFSGVFESELLHGFLLRLVRVRAMLVENMFPFRIVLRVRLVPE
jgi:hypothetical protein